MGSLILIYAINVESARSPFINLLPSDKIPTNDEAEKTFPAFGYAF
jgi:hypothetical protein